MSKDIDDVSNNIVKMGISEDNNAVPPLSRGVEEKTASEKECTSCEQKVEHETNGRHYSDTDIVSNSGVDSDIDVFTCANCGKEGASNSCNKCNTVKYCNAACKKKHRSKHKKACKRRVAEMYDEKLFKDHPPNEECPICFLPFPLDRDQQVFETCCGKSICMGCVYEMLERNGKSGLCAFCRTPHCSDEEDIEKMKKLMDKGNTEATYLLAGYYATGSRDFPQDHQKANELYLKSGELGCAGGYNNLGVSYRNGIGVESDMKKAQHYYELGAMGGNVESRFNLACLEGNAGNHNRGMMHLMVAARAGYNKALDKVKIGFQRGMITKDGYENVLRAYHERHREMKSDQRDRAVASGM